ncbi:CHAT domain-containing protein [Aurantiacibacter gilvus]|uniref:CHAT domain-containing protein n=1 Tax=Aurantiacibacter gilvus TaxID=3139141 RepID=A0ABU9IBL0_9SPHN
MIGKRLFASLLAVLAASMAFTPSAVAQRPPSPAVQEALDSDPRFAELFNAEADSDAEALDQEFAVVGYVGDTYPRDGELYLELLADAVGLANIVDYDGRYESELRERLIEAVPLAEATLGPDHNDTELMVAWREILLEQAGEGNGDYENVYTGFDEEADEEPYAWLADFPYANEAMRQQMAALREAAEGQSGEALIAIFREAARLEEDYGGVFWPGYQAARFAILDELYQIGEWEQMEREAKDLLVIYTEGGDLGNELAITVGQYLALARETQFDLEGATAALAPLVTHPTANRVPPELISPKTGDPMQPDHREGQARSQLARLLLESDGDVDLALESARFGTRYLIGYRQGRPFTQDVEAAIDREFRAPRDEPFGQDARQQFANLVEAAWRVRESGDSDDTALFAEAFAAAQESAQDRTTPAIARVAALAVAERAGLDGLAREREELGIAMQTLDGQEFLRARARQQDIDRELQEAAPEFFSLIRPSALTPEEAQALLLPGEAMLLVLPTQYGTHVLALTPDATAWHKSEWTEQDIRSQARVLRNDLDPWGAGIVNNWDGGFDANSAWILYRELIEPLMPTLEGSDALLYATGPALSSIPLTVLLLDEPAEADERHHDYRAMQWLGDRFAMAQLPSLSSLAFLRRDGAATSGARTMVGFADPVLEGEAATRGGRNAGLVGSQRLATVAGPGSNQTALADLTSLRALSRLPGTAREVQMLAQALAVDEHSVFIGPAATETAVKTQDLSDVRYLVFATHGLTAGEGGIASEPGLVFTPPEEATMADDGLLTASEILSLDLSADWVMLSACNTAAADGIGGGGLSGLARSFFYAGARSLLASHWPVIDEIAPLLTSTSVRMLEDNPGMSRAEALQQAMIDVRNNADIERADHPSSWAPFITVGDLR